MTLQLSAPWVSRRRAVVCGTACHVGGAAFTRSGRLFLRGGPGSRSHACHVHPDGRFFFLDVLPGRYTLEIIDFRRVDLQTREVIVPPAPLHPCESSVTLSVEVEALSSRDRFVYWSGKPSRPDPRDPH